MPAIQHIRAVTTVIFDEIAKVRSLVADFDGLLSGLFNTPGTSYAIGEAAPPSIPRLNYKSKFGHSSLDISCVSAQMTTHFDGEFATNINKIRDYCSERENLIESDLVRLGSTVRYVGFTLTSQLKFDNKDEITKVLTERFFNKDALLGSKKQPHEASFKIAFVEQDRYFVNFHASNYRAYMYQVPKELKGHFRMVNPSLKDFTESEAGIEITFDCNNKYLYDFVDKNGHKAGDFKAILDLTDEYQRTLIQRGVLNV